MFGRLFTPKPRSDDESVKRANLIVEAQNLRERVEELKKRCDDLEGENKELKHEKKFPIDVNLGDPSPTDKTKRASYVGQVAGLHKNILEPKLKQMISTARGLLEDSTNSRDFDLALKGATYAFWEILRWGEMMVNEQVALQAGEQPGSPVDNN